MSGYANPTQRYREVQVKTAAKDDLLILLLDGGVRFAEGGQMELEKGADEDREKRNDYFIRAQKIVLELIASLSPAIGLELYNQLQGLYQFTFQRIFEANLKSDLEAARDGVVIMKRIRDLWKEAVEHARKERAQPLQGAQPNSTLSVQG